MKTSKGKEKRKLQVRCLIRHGWAVQLTRDDDTTFLACGIRGDFTPVWIKSNRKWALEYKKELLAQGFKAKVVLVAYTMPVVLKENP